MQAGAFCEDHRCQIRLITFFFLIIKTVDNDFDLFKVIVMGVRLYAQKVISYEIIFCRWQKVHELWISLDDFQLKPSKH